MHCKQARNLLIHSLDRPLPPGEQDTVRDASRGVPGVPPFRRGDASLVRTCHQARAHATPGSDGARAGACPPVAAAVGLSAERQSRQVPQLVAFVVGALGVALAFLMLVLTLIVGLTGNTPAAATHERRLFVPEVWQDVQGWFNTLPERHRARRDHPRTLERLPLLVVAWCRTLAAHVGRDRQ